MKIQSLLLFCAFVANLATAATTPLTSSAPDGLGPLTLPAAQVQPLGTVSIDGTSPKRDLIVSAQNSSGDASLYLSKWLRDDPNGTPVFQTPVPIISPASGQAAVFQTPDNTIHALWVITANTLLHATLDTASNTFVQKSTTALPPPPSLPDFPSPTYTTRIAAIPNPDQSIDLLIELNDGVPPHTINPASADWRPYDAALIYSGNYSYSALLSIRLSNLATRPVLSAPVLATPRAREILFTASGLSAITLDPASPKALIAGSRFGNLYYLHPSQTTKFASKTPITTTASLLARHPAANPAPVAYPDPANNRDNLIVASEGPLYFYKFTGSFSPSGAPIFHPPTPILQTNATLNAGTNPVVTSYDWDNDGILDIIAGNAQGQLLFFKNIGTNQAPKFLPPVRIQADEKDLHVQAGYSNAISGMLDANYGYLSSTIIDWNQDGLPDVVVGDASGSYSIFINRGTPGNPKLEPQRTLSCDGLSLHGMWRVRPAVAHVGSTTYFLSVDDHDSLHLYQRIDDYNVRSITTVNLSGTKTPITVSSADGTHTGRCTLDLFDWDNDGNLDLLIGASTVNAIPRKTSTPSATAAILYLRNTGTNQAPAYAAPVPLIPTSMLPSGRTQISAVATLLDSANGLPNLLVADENGCLYLYDGQQLTPAPAAR